MSSIGLAAAGGGLLSSGGYNGITVRDTSQQKSDRLIQIVLIEWTCPSTFIVNHTLPPVPSSKFHRNSVHQDLYIISEMFYFTAENPIIIASYSS